MILRRWGAAVLWVTVLIALLADQQSLGRELQVWVGDQQRQVEIQSHNGNDLFRLNDLVEMLALRLRVRGSNLTITGARGEILITDGRPLVRSGDHYVLLSVGVWKRGAGDWYVPEDFLVNALSNIVSQKVEKQADGSFRLLPLKTNRVRVEMLNYPDHLSVIFEGSQSAPVKVREFRDYVDVTFSGFLVQPVRVGPSLDPRLVVEVEFNEQESLGSFRIQKGSQFASFRQYYLESAAKLIIEVYGEPSASSSESRPSVVPDPDRPSVSSVPSLLRTTAIHDVVVIDPGHGGVDYGVDAHQDLLEKVITLNVARRVEEELSQRGVKTRLTRVRDVQLLNEQRSAISNFYRCRLYVGIHLGGAPAESTRGPVVYVYAPPENSNSDGGRQGEAGQGLVPWERGQAEFLQRSRRLAASAQSELNQLFETDNQIVAARLAVLAPVRAPAVLVETGYLTNPDDQALLATPGFQERIAESIAQAITRFLR